MKSWRHGLGEVLLENIQGREGREVRPTVGVKVGVVECKLGYSSNLNGLVNF